MARNSSPHSKPLREWRITLIRKKAISDQAESLRKQLASLTGTDVGNGVKRGLKPGRPKGSKLKGRKVVAKYRSKKDSKLTWAGRGATPRWMKEEMKGGKKKEAFLIK